MMLGMDSGKKHMSADCMLSSKNKALHTIRSMFIPFFIKVGIILNFKHAKLEWKKVVLTNDQ